MEERLIMFIVTSLIVIFVSYIASFVHGSLFILSTIFASLSSLLFFYKNEYPILKLFLFFFLSTLIFSIFINLFFPNIYKEIKEELGMGEKLESKENLLRTIFSHNLSLYLQAFILSSLSIVGGFIYLFWNLLLFWILIINSINPFFTFIILAPHGILEFFSFYLASISGTKIFKNLILKEEISEKEILKMFLFGILILFIAALIEVLIISL
ncbi:MAG: stage II sporulation protein M [Nanopusillaceae archaeon]